MERLAAAYRQLGVARPDAFLLHLPDTSTDPQWAQLGPLWRVRQATRGEELYELYGPSRI